MGRSGLPGQGFAASVGRAGSGCRYSASHSGYVHGYCGRSPYVTSELVPLAVARVLTPVFGLHGTLNLIALGILMCGIASVAIATLQPACG